MRLRFSIRDLLWLTVVVALAVGWWLEHRKFDQQKFDLRREAAKLRVDLFEAKANLQAAQGAVRGAWGDVGPEAPREE